MSKRKAPAPKRGMVNYCLAASALLLWGLIFLGGQVLTPAPQVTTVIAGPTPVDYFAMRSQTVELIAAGKGHGSGVIISPNFILTVNHVATMADGAPLDVLFSDGTKAHAALVWADKKRDVALMVLDRATKVKPAKLATVAPKVGDELWSAGYPLYLPLSIIHGSVVSVAPLDKGFGDQAPAVITIDASIARGDSGGPTFNAAGEVIGLNDIVVADALPGMMPAPFYFGLAGIIGTQFIADDVRAVVGS